MAKIVKKDHIEELVDELEETKFLIESIPLDRRLNENYRHSFNKKADILEKSVTTAIKYSEASSFAVFVGMVLTIMFLGAITIKFVPHLPIHIIFISGFVLLLITFGTYISKNGVSDGYIERLDGNIKDLAQALRVYGSLRSVSDQHMIETIDTINTLIDDLEEKFG